MKITTLVLSGAFGILSQVVPAATTMPEPRPIEINDTTLDVVDIGEGVPIVFVHGAISDLRAWADYVEPVSAGHRFIAYTRRNYGERAWPENPVYDYDVHGKDLVALLQALDTGPAYLVSWSNSAYVVTRAAATHPELVRGIVYYEPDVGAGLMDGDMRAELYTAVSADWQSRWDSVAEQLQAGDERHALRKMVELVFELPPGGFESLEPAARQLHLENARTIPLLFAAVEATPITCNYVAAIKAPALVLLGIETHKAWSMEAERMADCMPNATLTLVPGVNHRGPVVAPATIASSILDFVDAPR